MKKIKLLLDKIGIPDKLIRGYIGVVFFVLGSCIENIWFSDYLFDIGMKATFISSVFSLYGISVTVFSWVTSFLVNSYGTKKIIKFSIIVFFLSLIFLLLVLHYKVFYLLPLVYMFRGLVYPLFAYSFLIMITLNTPDASLGKSTAWFWVCFNIGMTIVGPKLSTFFLPLINAENLLILGGFFVVLGSLFVFSLDFKSMKIKNKNNNNLKKELKLGIEVYYKEPRMVIALIVKAINNIGQFGFVVMMPLFLPQYRFTLIQWSNIWMYTYILNLFATIFFGYLGDKIGWRKVVMKYAGTLTGFSCVLIYLSTVLFPANIFFLSLSFTIFSIGVAAFTPLSALLPEMIPDQKSISISVLNLGSGLSNFLGPFIVTLFYGRFNSIVVFIIFSLLYFLSSILAIFLKIPKELKLETSKT